jgi:Ceramidase
MNTKIFAYCERGTDPGFWAEPLNAITNLAFIIAALVAWRMHMAKPAADRRIVDALLIALVAIIGIGSFLFHTFATRWAAAADVIPITIFMIAYMGYTLCKFLRLSWWAVIVGLAAFIATLVFARPVICGGERCLNGSAGYLPAFAALVLLGGLLIARRHRAGMSLLAAGLVLGASLTFRTIDRSICNLTQILGEAPIGTHFLWHLLNATLLFLLLRAAVLYGRRQPDASAVARDAA